VKRLAFNSFAAISLALCIGLTPLWCGRRVTLNRHRSSTEIEVHHGAVYWLYCSAEGYGGTVSFFVSDPLELKKVFADFDSDQLRPEHVRVRAHHPSGLWLGSERTGQDNDRVGWFRLSFVSALVAIGPALWVILRIRDRFKCRAKKVRPRFAVKMRWLSSGISVTALLIFAWFWIASSRGYHISLGWGWLLQTEPDQCGLTLLAIPGPRETTADLWGNWYWVERQYRSINPGVKRFHFERVLPAPPKRGLFDNDNTSNSAPPTGPRGFSLTLPDWFLCAIASLLPACEMLALLRRRFIARFRDRRGLCSQCGYDLRATSECCPECGHAVAAIRRLAR